MTTLDLRKQWKHLYAPSARKVELVDVPELKFIMIDGRIEPREILDLTVTYDHDVIDGAPAARFTQRLVELIEGGVGLDD